MVQGIHFISGLPRSGSTLLAALLRQNPALHAGITSPVGSMFGALLVDMSAGNETSVFIDDDQRSAVLRGVVDSYYGVHQSGKIIFDTNRIWTARIDLLAKLFPESRMICCVRHIPWIIDSVERLIRANPLELSKIFDFEKGGTVYSRADGLMGSSGMIGFSLAAMKQAMHGTQSSRIMLLPYDLLVSNPAAAMEAVYNFTGLSMFQHDFDNVAFETKEFDARLGTPGLHNVHAKVTRVERHSILPPDLWQRYEGASIWRDPAFLRTIVESPS
jgi:sulfotransferase